MFQILVLVCSIGLASPDCKTDNAQDVIWGPVASNEVQCAFGGQAFIAPTTLAPRDEGKFYIKIFCTRIKQTAHATPADERD